MICFLIDVHVRPLFCCLGGRYDGKLSPGLKALGELPLAGWVQILAAIAVVELTVGKQDYENKVGADAALVLLGLVVNAACSQ